MQPRIGSRFSIGHVLVVCLFLGFSVLVLGGWGIWRSRAPIPERVIGPDGTTLFGAAEIHAGQAVYQKHGLMDWGSVLGHGTYYGPDFTAEALHMRVETMRDALARESAGRGYAELDAGAQASIAAQVVGEIRHNRYEAASGEPAIHTLLWLRILPDTIFIGLGVVPLLIGLVRAWNAMRPVTPIEATERARPARMRGVRESESISVTSATDALS